MVILLSYQLETPPTGSPIRVRTEEPFLCPICQKTFLAYRDSVRRLCRKEGGRAEWFLVPRGFCTRCQKLHRMLPVFLCPFKHYLAAVISGVLDGRIAPDRLSAEDYPCEITMERWRLWAGDGFQNLAGDPLYVCFSKNP